MTSRPDIGMTEEEREVMCQAYKQAKVHPNNEATPSDDRLVSVWGNVSDTFDQKGYVNRSSLPVSASGKLSFSLKGMEAAKIICGYVEGYEERRLSVGTGEEGYVDVILTGKKLAEYPEATNEESDVTRHKDYELYHTEEGFWIHETEYLILGHSPIDAGEEYPVTQPDIQRRLVRIDDAQANDSGVKAEIADYFAMYLE